MAFRIAGFSIMRIRFATPLLPLLSAVILLASCEAAGTLPGGGPRSDYAVARQALETGNYTLAIRRYESLIASQEGRSAARLQLELAHALLRADRYGDAIALASRLTDRRGDSIQASALAVRGTARHEEARSRMEQGENGAELRALLEGARDDLADFLRDHASLDAAGSMRARAQLIEADLAGMG